MNLFLRKVAVMVQGWAILCPKKHRLLLDQYLTKLKDRASSPGRIAWLMGPEAYLYQHAHDWNTVSVPPEVEVLLSNYLTSLDEAVKMGNGYIFRC